MCSFLVCSVILFLHGQILPIMLSVLWPSVLLSSSPSHWRSQLHSPLRCLKMCIRDSLSIGLAVPVQVVRTGPADVIGPGYQLQQSFSIILKKFFLHLRHMFGKGAAIPLPFEEIKAHSMMGPDAVYYFRFLPLSSHSASAPYQVSCLKQVPVQS